MTTPQELRVPGLSKLQWLELKKALGDSVTSDDANLEHGGHGELATVTAVVLVSLAALRILSAWLMRERSQGRSSHTIETVSATGERTVNTITYEFDDRKAPPRDVLLQLAHLAHVSVKDLTEDPSAS